MSAMPFSVSADEYTGFGDLIDQIAKMTGLPRIKVLTALDELEREGAITVAFTAPEAQ